jgi:hypothetical protein
LSEVSSNSIQWIKTDDTAYANGIEIKRPLSSECSPTSKVKVSLYYDNCPERFKAIGELVKLESIFGLSFKSTTRSSVFRAMWQYVKAKKLLDPKEPQYVNCDELLESIVGRKRILLGDVDEKVSSMLVPADPIEITYALSLSGEVSPMSMNVPVQVPVAGESGFSGWFERLPSLNQEIVHLNSQVT